MHKVMSLLEPKAVQSLLYYAARAPHGAIVEIGVYQGGSAWHLARLGRPLFLYDTGGRQREQCLAARRFWMDQGLVEQAQNNPLRRVFYRPQEDIFCLN